jgi:peptide/nickel transport system ATP-binding protein
MGLLPANARRSGTVELDGDNILALDEKSLRDIRGPKIAMVFQEPMVAFDPLFTVGDQIAETIVRHEGASRKDALKRAKDLFDLVQIPLAERRLGAYPHEMSGGMRQRAMIALALSCKPSVLLADEPTSALDVTVQIQILLLLRELQRSLGMAIIMVTHDVGVAIEACDRIGVIYAGRFVETGTTEDVIQSPSHPYTAGLLASTVLGTSRGTALKAIPGSPPELDRLPAGCSFQARCGFRTEPCAAVQPEAFYVTQDHSTRCVRVQNGEIDPQDVLART